MPDGGNGSGITIVISGGGGGSSGGGGEECYVQALGRTACAQIIYAQAERLANRSTPKNARPSSRIARPVSASGIHATHAVADALADIAAAFVEKIGRSSAARSELAGRGSCNLVDVLGAVDAFAPVTNSTPRDLMKYAMFQEIPFPYPIPRFPVLPAPKKRKRELFVQPEKSEEKREERIFIEQWMPPLPSAHTYVATPVFVKRDAGKRDASELDRQRRGVEKSLARLKEAKASANRGGLLAAVAAVAPDNPFLVLPKVGNGRIFDEDIVETRELTEKKPQNNIPGDAHDSNVASRIEVPKNAAHDQKRAKVERILSEAGSATTTAIGGPGPSGL